MSTDYTACKGIDCPIKDKCHRFSGPKDPLYQSYFVEIPGKWGFRRETFKSGEIFDHREFQCDMFWGESQDQIMKTLNNIMNGQI